jgi:glyoxylase-like metal-dependent hydrolase (beta-lactamase superfamily II)
MEEIANNVFIETKFPGVILVAFKLKEGIITVDAPFRREDQRAWQSRLSVLGDCTNRFLVMLDTHVDRTWGVSAIESVIVSHANAVDILEGRPASCRSQDIDPGAACEAYDLPSNVHWALPDMTYTGSLLIYWDDQPVILTHHPGAHIAATWLQYDAEKLLFVGDSVMVNQPPFLQWANLEIWVEELKALLSDTFAGYTFISGRNGVVRRRAIEKWMNYLINLKDTLDEIAEGDGEVVDLIEQAPNLLKRLSIDRNLSELYKRRLTWGLETYYRRHYSEIKQS